eukprot:CAMPEP_0184866312 /NCGR_PEP_ID=MMETSP0580-20130426/21818_1 /TAXON_ID=1118495 /ORGANISM="Dactyliosolen fragilissimus" /LENGTH=395 /DNA_ID=CAMNT_0027365935 /DNA_START=82 /DNA_END=1269 /DNA_ORIENTATION=+
MEKTYGSVSIATATTAAILASVGTAAAGYLFHRSETARIRNLRKEERRGRINAEIKLRNVLKNGVIGNSGGAAMGTCISNVNDVERNGSSRIRNSICTQECNAGKNCEEMRCVNNDMFLRCIGVVVSPFMKRMGTPRQGALAPDSRGYIQIDPSVAMETLEGLEMYSHVWLVFKFHANTDIPGSAKTKVRPPRAGGLKVGQLATRSPHRPNALGLSLVKFSQIDFHNKRLHITALDLVNGTPIYDVKPVVPWDEPGYMGYGDRLVVPNWVSQDDALSDVVFSDHAETVLRDCVEKGKLSPLYKKKDDGFLCALKAIKQILAQDPRAQTKRGKLDSKEPYKIVFCSIQVEFLVLTTAKIEVIDVQSLNFKESEQVDGIPFANEGTMNQGNSINNMC